jgi:hypothetical protein
VAPAAAREQTFKLEAADGKEIAQHIPVPVDRPGELVVEAEWTGSRSLRLWIEDHGGRSLARWGGLGAGRVSTHVDDYMADPDKPLKVRIRTIGRKGSVQGSITVRYPSLADPPEAPDPEPEAATVSVPSAIEPVYRWNDAPHAGTRWQRPLTRLAKASEGDQGLALRAFLGEVGRVTRGYVALGPALPPPVDPEGEPTEAELERTWALEDLGREVNALVRLADEASLPDEVAAELRRLLANVSELARRRELHGERSEGVGEALAALASALDEAVGGVAEPAAGTGS